MILVLIPCAVLGFLLYRQNFERRIAQAVEQNAAALQSMTMDIRIRATQVETIIERLAYHNAVQRYLSTASLEGQIVRLMGEVTELLQSNETYLQHLSANILLTSPREPFAEQYNTALKEARYADDQFFQDYLRGPYLTGWGEPDYLMPNTVYLGEILIPYYHKVVQGFGNRLGTVKCAVKPDQLFASLSTWDDSLALMVHRQGHIIFQKGDPAITLPTASITDPLIENGLLYLSVELPRMDYQLVMAVDYGMMHRQSLLSSLPIILLGLGVGFFMMLAARVLLRTMLLRLQTTIDSIHEIKAGDTVPMLPEGGQDEVGRLVEAFNRLLRHIDANMEELLRKEKDKQQARLMALQYQVNPHFLFNSLYWLQMKAEEEGHSNDVSAAISSLGAILHYNLSESNRATLAQEAHQLRAYVDFMRIRQSSEIHLTLHWEESLNQVKILRFTFQPLMENAIRHGLIPGKALHLQVEAKLEGVALMIRLKNDGRPMSAEDETRVEALLRSAAEEPQDGIGLANLVQRLRLYYGTAAAIRLESATEWTAFVITLPYQEE